MESLLNALSEITVFSFNTIKTTLQKKSRGSSTGYVLTQDQTTDLWETIDARVFELLEGHETLPRAEPAFDAACQEPIEEQKSVGPPIHGLDSGFIVPSVDWIPVVLPNRYCPILGLAWRGFPIQRLAPNLWMGYLLVPSSPWIGHFRYRHWHDDTYHL